MYNKGYSFSIWHWDFLLLAGLIALSVVGLTVLYSASGNSWPVVKSQLIRMVLGFVVMMALAQLNPRTVALWTPWLYIFGVLMLLAVLFFGTISKGAQRWLDIGFIRFQPSEMIKLTVPLMLAWYFSERSLPPSGTHIFVALVLVLFPTFLIVKQPDLGTALLILSSGLFVIFFAGLHWWVFISVLGLGGVFVLLAIYTPVLHYLLYPYQLKRVHTFLNPESDVLGAGYHIVQSKIAIGSGGLYGKGLSNGTQSQLQFLPERSTDFIFAVFSEEFGLIGVVVLLTLYFYIITRGLFIAIQAQTTFGRLLAGSLSLTFFIYVFINMGMVSGILPVVGLPLPLLSYGGTAIVTLFAGFGLLMGIHTHRRMLG